MAAVFELTGGAASLGWVALKALLMFLVTILGLRLSERRTLAQLSAFDFAVAVAIGAIIGRTATSSTTSFATGAVAIVTLLVAHRCVTALRRRGWLHGWIDRSPGVLVAHGQVRHPALARAGLTTGDLYAMLRERGIGSLDDVEYLLYETRGAVSLLRSGEQAGPLVEDGLASSGYPSGRSRRDLDQP